MTTKLLGIIAKMLVNLFLWSCIAWFLTLAVRFVGSGGEHALARPLADYFDQNLNVVFLVGFVVAAVMAHYISKRFSFPPFLLAIIEELASWALNLGSFLVAAGLPFINLLPDVPFIEGGLLVYGVFVLISLARPTEEHT